MLEDGNAEAGVERDRDEVPEAEEDERRPTTGEDHGALALDTGERRIEEPVERPARVVAQDELLARVEEALVEVPRRVAVAGEHGVKVAARVDQVR